MIWKIWIQISVAQPFQNQKIWQGHYKIHPKNKYRKCNSQHQVEGVSRYNTKNEKKSKILSVCFVLYLIFICDNLCLHVHFVQKIQ